jgi:hypoxanthine phosphoribosyltransferase
MGGLSLKKKRAIGLAKRCVAWQLQFLSMLRSVITGWDMLPPCGSIFPRCEPFHRPCHGAQSQTMVDHIERVLFHEQTILSRLDELAAQITADYAGRELTVVAVLNGSIIFLADLLRRIPLPLKFDSLSVSSYHGGTESTGTVTFDQISLPDIDGRHVLILDDILDSGRTLEAIGGRLQKECQPASIRVCVLLSKRKERATDTPAHYVGFEIGDEFVVGYGLDFDERYRNLPFIGVLKPAIFEQLPQPSSRQFVAGS